MATSGRIRKAVKKSATTKKASPIKRKKPVKKAASKGSGSSAVKKKKPTKKAVSKKKNKLGVKNSLVNNINARKEKGIARSKKKSTVNKKSYKKMAEGWKEK